MSGLRAPLAVALGAAAALGALAAFSQSDPRRSGYADMGAPVRAMQDDDFANPGMLWVREGEAAWKRRAGAANKACADCHAGAEPMAGVAARYPAFDAATGKPVDLSGRIERCRTENQQAAPAPPESREPLALLAYVARQSRGLPISPPDDARLKPSADAGEAHWRRRQGQLNLSCANCHDDNAGQKLAGATIPQAHPTGYPIYRLEWQTVGSLKRRLRNCLVGMRAEPFEADGPEYVEIELYLMRRAAGMPLESPGVRP